MCLGPGLAAASGNAAVEEEAGFQDNYLLGDWGGFRTTLWEHGIRPEFLLITDSYGNPFGGLAQGFTDYSLFCADLLLETGKLLGLPGGEFHIGFAVNFGTQLSENFIGNTFPVQTSDIAPPGPRLTFLSYTQSLFDDKLSLRVGRLALNSLYGEEFAASQYFFAFTSVAFNSSPFAIFYNAPGAASYPTTTWGARAKFAPVEEFYIMAGIYNGDPNVSLADSYGMDFTFNGPPFGIGEIGWRRNQGRNPAGLPGNLKVGAFVVGGSVPQYDSNNSSDGNFGVYAIADQALLRFGEPSSGRHLGIFGSFVVGPDAAVNPMPYYFNSGLVAYGPLACRPGDFLALGVAYGAYSSQLRSEQSAQQSAGTSVLPQLYEMTVELSYGIRVLPGLIIQPGVQMLVNPGGNPGTPSALALGVNAEVSF